MVNCTGFECNLITEAVPQISVWIYLYKQGPGVSFIYLKFKIIYRTEYGIWVSFN